MSRIESIKDIFNARSVAVVGASRKTGHPSQMALMALRSSGCTIYPVNLSAKKIMGIKAYPDVSSIPDSFDLAFIAIPADKVPSVLVECAKKGAKGAVINTAGFKEIGTEEGRKKEVGLKEVAESTGMGIIGPNCVGFHHPNVSTMPLPRSNGASKKVGTVSQSGWFCGFYAYQCITKGVDFSMLVSSGNEADLNKLDFLEYLSEDDDTDIITMYLEGVDDGGKFMKLVKTITPKKPVITWKVGLTGAGSIAASSHTGSLAGSESIYNAVFSQTGMIQADSGKDLIDFTIAFSHCKLPKGNRVGIITSPGGFGVATADACERYGLKMPKLSDETSKELKKVLPDYCFTKNPVDLTMMAIQNPNYFIESMKVLDSDPDIDSMIVITGATFYDGFMAKSGGDIEKPFILVSSPYWSTQEGSDVLSKAGIASYVYPEEAVKSLAALTRYAEMVRKK
ncbi:MAG: CoA-binding protein [Halobacteriota archaeon]|nr:CoA-binding protein [Halobacteriota archaeon]